MGGRRSAVFASEASTGRGRLRMHGDLPAEYAEEHGKKELAAMRRKRRGNAAEPRGEGGGLR